MSIAVGRNHSVCLADNGSVWVFGSNSYGQLGFPQNQNVRRPVNVPFDIPIKQVACGEYYTVCLDSEGFVWTFGFDYYSQQGMGNIHYNRSIPTKVEGMPPIVSLSCGSLHTVCIDYNGTIWCFGDNTHGQLGFNQLSTIHTPRQLEIENEFITSVACGLEFSLILCESGYLYICSNKYRILENKSLPEPVPLAKVTFNEVIKSISCGHQHSIILSEDGKVYKAEYTHGGVPEQHPPFVRIDNLPIIEKISCGYFHCLCIDEKQDLWTFGRNANGQLGLGDNHSGFVPARVKGIKEISEISNGGFHTIVKDNYDNVWGFGANYSGQLGIRKAGNKYFPVKLIEKFSHVIGNKMEGSAKSARK